MCHALRHIGAQGPVSRGMPVHATYDLLSDPPRPVEAVFEVAARRILTGWLDAGAVVATVEDLRLAAQFLRRTGLTVELVSTFEVRLVSQRGDSTVVTREDAILTAVRSLAALDTQRTTRSIARAA